MATVAALDPIDHVNHSSSGSSGTRCGPHRRGRPRSPLIGPMLSACCIDHLVDVARFTARVARFDLRPALSRVASARASDSRFRRIRRTHGGRSASGITILA